MSKNWIKYWSKKNIWGSSYIWKKNSNILYTNIKKNFFINKKDILDIGCGTGELIERLSVDAKSIYGVDVSENYIKDCKKKFSNNKKVKIIKFKKNYKNLSRLNKKFSFIFCNSVIQYFSNEREIEELIKSVKKVSKKGSKLLISDIMPRNNQKSLIKLIFYSIARGYFFALFFQYLILLFNPKYRKLELKFKLLEIDIDDLIKKIRYLSKRIIVLSNPITINTDRKHIIIEF